MQVRCLHKSPLSGDGKQASNILWEGKWLMPRGEFPPYHPCVAKPTRSSGSSSGATGLTPSPKATASRWTRRRARLPIRWSAIFRSAWAGTLLVVQGGRSRVAKTNDSRPHRPYREHLHVLAQT